MFDKIQKIVNIGQFKDFNAAGDLSLRKINLIYGENGTGKTTLAHIMRSFQTGESKYIDVKKESNGACVELRKTGEQGLFRYNGTGWSEKGSGIEIFDSAFVEENIHSGYTVGNDHKKNIVNLILGDDAVAKNIEYINLLKQEKTLTAEIDTLYGTIKTNNDFLANIKACDFFNEKREVRDDLKELIDKQKNLVINLTLKEKISTYALLEEIKPLGGDLSKLQETLSKSITDISKEAELNVKRQLETFSEEGESWLEKGYLSIGKDNLCPFCSSDITTNSLIDSYSQYFNKEYKELKDKLNTYSDLSLRIRRIFDDKISSKDKSISAWNSLWKPFIKEDIIFPKYDNIDLVMQKLDKLILLKKESVLEPVDSVQLTDFIEQYSNLSDFVIDLNKVIEEYNKKIITFKQGLQNGNINQEKTNLINFQITLYQKELSADEHPMHETWLLAIKKLNELQIIKDKTIPATREELNSLIANNCKEHQDCINKLLKKMNAKFSLVMDNKLNYTTKPPSYSYSIKVGSKNIPIKGDDSDPFKSACLGNCLSEGDKTSLAFAFFVSRLEKKASLVDKIIVFDDPISSLDAHRRSQTESILRGYKDRVKRIFILSHDAHFLRKIFKSCPKSETKSMEIEYTLADGSKIKECDIIAKTKSSYIRNFETLCKYDMTGGNDLEAARSIRTYLEGLLRRLLPNEFDESDWLGGFIGKIRANPNHSLSKIVSELDEINNYSKEFHHDTAENVQEQITDKQELLGFIERTLKLKDMAFLNTII